jgi:hypothetical protein
MSLSSQNENSLTDALRHLEVVEANLVKLERLWREIRGMIGNGPAFGSTPEYEDMCRSYDVILPYLTKIDGWKPSAVPWDFDAIGQSRLDALNIDEIGAIVAIENEIEKPGAELRQYRFLLNQKRRQVTREAMLQLIDAIDAIIREMGKELEYDETEGLKQDISKEKWKTLNDYISQIDTLLGSTARPARWGDLMRHKRFAKYNDFFDIRESDWPTIKKGIMANIYDANDPMPSGIDDISILVSSKPKGHVTKELNWPNLDAEQFERLIYTLISSAEGYENPQWLMQTTAPDRGRDLSVDRIIKDSLGGITRKRVIIQCKHWLAKSIAVVDVATLQSQMKLWEPPRVDVCIVATSGRFTADAVALIEKENQSDKALMIEMWPESHLETILAKRPDLIADFKLR